MSAIVPFADLDTLAVAVVSAGSLTRDLGERPQVPQNVPGLVPGRRPPQLPKGRCAATVKSNSRVLPWRPRLRREHPLGSSRRALLRLNERQDVENVQLTRERL